MHIGNARTAVLNALWALQNKGRLLLRIDDTDQARGHQEFESALRSDLSWLGLKFDEIFWQSKRLSLYQKAIEKLKEEGRLYPCYETSAELTDKRNAQTKQKRPPRYDREALNLSSTDKNAKEAQGLKPHWRFFLKSNVVTWDDAVKGPLSFNPETLSDPVLVREDGSPTFLLSGSVDEIDLGITHILRGEDHIANTAIQAQLIDALAPGAKRAWGHLPLVVSEDGKALSKRLGSLTLQTLREEGRRPEAVRDFLIGLGAAHPGKQYDSLHQAAQTFSLGDYGGSAAKLDLNMLLKINTLKVQGLPQSVFVDFLKKNQKVPPPDAFFDCVRTNIENLDDLLKFYRICFEDLPDLSPQDPDYLQLAAENLPDGPWNENAWQDWTDTLKKKTERKGKDLFPPLRFALTHEKRGPQMSALLPLIGRQKALKRITQT